MKKKWIETLSQVDDSFLEEANPFSKEEASSDTLKEFSPKKHAKKWYQSKILVAGIACLLLLSAALLFVPYRTTAMMLSFVFDHEHYEYLTKLDSITNISTDKTPFTSIREQIDELFSKDIKNDPSSLFNSGTLIVGSIASTTSNSYVEVTDNQVKGVIEADRIKRSENYMYYLYGSTLYTYSIDEEDSKMLDSYELWDADSMLDTSNQWYFYNPIHEKWELYLSEDCNRVTVLIYYFDKDYKPWVEIVSLNVENPADIKKISSAKTPGYYLSSRMTDGNLLLITKYTMSTDEVNYMYKSTCLPYSTSEYGTCYVEAENIYTPENADSLKYITVQLYQEKDLKIKDGYAFLSHYDGEVYVSDSDIYITRKSSHNIHSTADNPTDGILHTQEEVTEISRLKYDKNGFEYQGTATVSGDLENQYSMDEYEGILRVVTTLRGFTYTQKIVDGETKVSNLTEFLNAALYCIDIDSMNVVSEIKFFAPADEKAESVRFDKNKAYVCTVYAPELKDPVFAFDLSDVHNITYVDTGTIDGYSNSLVTLNDGYLLGIGVGSSKNDIKIEVYKEREETVDSICSYNQTNIDFSSEYKAYYIDRTYNLVGFSASSKTDDKDTYYELLQFANEELTCLAKVSISGDVDYIRGVYIDSYLYALGENGMIVIEKVEME